MRISDLRSDMRSHSPQTESIHLARLFILAVTVAGGFAALAVGIPWLILLTPRWLIRGASISFLWSLLAIYVLALPAILAGGLWSSLAASRARRRRDRAALVRSLRQVLLASSCLAGLIAMEIISVTVLQSFYRIPKLPTRFATSRDRHPTGSSQVRPDEANGGMPANPASVPPPDDGLYLVVIGESSAQGEPYHPWLSVGQIVGWQLERVFPGRSVRVDVRADGGLCLEQAVLRLSNLERRPDAIIVFAGHNEFQTRFGWSRNVRHYIEEGPESPLALLELGRASSSTIRLILNTLDRYHGETPTPRRVTRELVDHPLCLPKEYRFLLEDFHRRLDALAVYCRRIGTLPVLIVPGSNDGTFEPSRSVLSGSTPADDRKAFAHAFRIARATEAADPSAAIAAYRRLVGQHPEFAESHYRLARLLARAGDVGEARRHFTLARDLDGLPLRCPGDFRAAVRTVAGRHGAMLIDGPEILARLSPDGILDDRFYHDAQHLNLAGMVVLAQETLEALHRRRAFGWPESVPVPHIELEATARHFGLDSGKWVEICRRTAAFYARTAYVGYDPMERLDLAVRYDRAARALAAGGPLRESGLPSLTMPIPILQRAKAQPAVPVPP